jgi:hypothetical protein
MLKKIKSITGLIIAGFFIFAPPGTLIIGGFIILVFLRDKWLLVGSALSLAALLVACLLLRKKFVLRQRGKK